MNHGHAVCLPRGHTALSGARTAPARRRWLALVLTAMVSSPGVCQSALRLEVWIELSEPAASNGVSATERHRIAERARRQQQQIAIELQRLGAVELARVRHPRNAIAVRISADRLDAVRAIPGVLHVRPTEGLHPRELMAPALAPKTQPR